jgi:hypothetical protein
MNFDADRLSKLSGLGTVESTGVLTESVELPEVDVEVEEGDEADEGDDLEENNHGLDEDDEAPLFELADDSDEGAEEVDEGFGSIGSALKTAKDYWFGKSDADPNDSEGASDLDERRDILANFFLNDPDAIWSNLGSQKQNQITNAFGLKESAPLTMETLRETVLELRDEILAENEAEQQALTEAPARAAIRKEIQALLAEMPTDAATNWMYGKKGKPSSNNEKSRATTLLGVGFENSNN